MFRGHPKCQVCGRRSFPGDLNDNYMCEMCEEAMIAQKIAMEDHSEDEEEEEAGCESESEDSDSDSDSDSANDDIPLSKLPSSTKGSGYLCQHKGASSKSIGLEVRRSKNLANAPGVKPKTSPPPTKMMATNTATTTVVTPNPKCTIQPKSHHCGESICRKENKPSHHQSSDQQSEIKDHWRQTIPYHDIQTRPD
ncbi:unnamed protein product [Cylindrotheca closterium]|uniref:Uncharacterized protein n=1 Tax=Cylindrotheca closterium TaxID=2856 RepID=A0AAD2CN20_9STRA|nr:unnamed protein product [Cylindrotheca closterium]